MKSPFPVNHRLRYVARIWLALARLDSLYAKPFSNFAAARELEESMGWPLAELFR